MAPRAIAGVFAGLRQGHLAFSLGGGEMNPKFDIAPQKWWLEDNIHSFCHGNFVGVMLNFRGVFHKAMKQKDRGQNLTP